MMEQHQKNESTARILALVHLLSANNELTRQDIFVRLPEYYGASEGASARKFERDLEFLQEQGYKIEHMKAKGLSTRYRLVRESGSQALLIASGDEIEALTLIFNLFANPNAYMSESQEKDMLPFPSQPSHPFAESALSLVERIISLLPENQQRQVQRGIRKPYVYFNIQVREDYLQHRDTIDKLIEAIAWRRQIHFEYLPVQRDMVVHPQIDPYYIYFGDGHFYLLGYSHMSHQHLEFRLDRIKAETLTLLPTRIDVERRQHPIEFRYWISRDIAKRGLSQRWLWQTIEREEDNGHEKRRVLIRAAAYNEWRIVRQLLTYGDQVELIEPPHLRESMRKTILRMVSMYEGGVPKDKDGIEHETQ